MVVLGHESNGTGAALAPVPPHVESPVAPAEVVTFKVFEARQRVRERPPTLDSVYVRRGKPVFDRAVGLSLLVLSSPVLVATAAAVRLRLGRPVLFTQQRIGEGGAPFTIYKFRTMVPDRRCGKDRRAQPRPGGDRRVTHKCERDPRITRLGRILRISSLDELPQLLNVIQGSMSLVGPRPELVEVVERYEHWQHLRHNVKPGITGLWQVTMRDRDGHMHEHTDIDLEYIDRLSLRTDLWILCRTAGALFTRIGG